jgi:hypothetical protein
MTMLGPKMTMFDDVGLQHRHYFYDVLQYPFTFYNIFYDRYDDVDDVDPLFQSEAPLFSTAKTPVEFLGPFW